MKNRRSTIIVAILVTLVGTPRVWQEFGNILASLQHKTQNKLLNMVVSSQVREGVEEQVAEAIEPESPGACPNSKFYQVADNRNSVNPATPRKLRTQRRIALSHDGSSALASNAGIRESRHESLPRPEESLSWVGENQLSMHSIASVPPELLMDKSSVTEFVTIPRVNVIAPAFAVRGTELIKLKKAFEESKGVRQKIRYIISKSTPPLPST